jgi:YfiH family protein
MSLPSVPGSFRWTDETWGAGLRCVPLEPLAPHVFASRHLALDRDGELELGGALGVDAIAMVTQVHGRTVAVVRDGAPVPERKTEADALIGNAPGIALAVRTADCVPLLLADRGSEAVAAVHAGWRGTAAGAATEAVAALGREFGTRPVDIVAAIGPSIGPCCYEVGSELVDAFAAAGHERHLIARWFPTPPPPRGSRTPSALRLDVAGANRDQLLLAGVPEAQIFSCDLCTAMHPDVLTSYRAEGKTAGRIVAAIRPRPSRI